MEAHFSDESLVASVVLCFKKDALRGPVVRWKARMRLRVRRRTSEAEVCISLFRSKIRKKGE